MHKQKKQMKTNEKDSIGRVERFDFAYAEKIHKETGGWDDLERDGWYIQLHSADWPVIVEYAPADENVYFVLKNFYRRRWGRRPRPAHRT